MRLTTRRLAGTLLAAVALVVIAIPQVGYAAISVVRIVTPAGITIDGSSGDWDEPSKDFLSDMYTAGKPDKPRRLTEALIRLMDDPALASSLAAKARENAAQFTWDQHNRTVEEMYVGLLDE